jgi:hypothetical protein
MHPLPGGLESSKAAVAKKWPISEIEMEIEKEITASAPQLWKAHRIMTTAASQAGYTPLGALPAWYKDPDALTALGVELGACLG